VWNSSADSVVGQSAESVDRFKSRLDKFWSMHDFVYDYRASPLTFAVIVRPIFKSNSKLRTGNYSQMRRPERSTGSLPYLTKY